MNIEKVSFTPMSFIVYFNQEATKQVRKKWHEVNVELEIKDDLGNVYLGEGNGGMGKDTYSMNWSKTFEKLDPNATKLIITPYIDSSAHDSTTSGKVEINKNGRKVISAQTKPAVERDEFIMEDIVIELEK